MAERDELVRELGAKGVSEDLVLVCFHCASGDVAVVRQLLAMTLRYFREQYEVREDDRSFRLNLSMVGGWQVAAPAPAPAAAAPAGGANAGDGANGGGARPGGDPPPPAPDPNMVLVGYCRSDVGLGKAQGKAWDGLVAVAGNSLAEFPAGVNAKVVRDVWRVFVSSCYQKALHSVDLTVKKASSKPSEEIDETKVRALLAAIAKAEHAPQLDLKGSNIARLSVLKKMFEATRQLRFPSHMGVTVPNCTPIEAETGVSLKDTPAVTIKFSDGRVVADDDDTIKAAAPATKPWSLFERFRRFLLSMYLSSLSVDATGRVLQMNTPTDAVPRYKSPGQPWITPKAVHDVIKKVEVLVKTGMSADELKTLADAIVTNARTYHNELYDDGERPNLTETFKTMIGPNSVVALKTGLAQIGSASGGDGKTSGGGGKPGGKPGGGAGDGGSRDGKGKTAPAAAPSPTTLSKGQLTAMLKKMGGTVSFDQADSPPTERKRKKPKRKRREAEEGAGDADEEEDGGDDDEDESGRMHGGNPNATARCKRPQECKRRERKCKFLCWNCPQSGE